VFVWSDTAWVQRGGDIDGEAQGDQSGYSVSLAADGQTVAIGAKFRNSGNGPNSGYVRLFVWSDTAWVQRGDDIDGEAEGDKFGHSVSLAADGQTVAIGARFNSGVRTYQLSCT
jgi:hypothetical protein